MTRARLATVVRIVWRDPFLWACSVLVLAFVMFDGLSHGHAATPLGVFGVLLALTDSNLTYGLGLAFVAAVVCAARVWKLDEVLHSSGMLFPDRVLLAGLAGTIAALIMRVDTVVAGLLAGIAQSIVQGGHLALMPAGRWNVSTVLTSQVRTVLLYALAGVLGAVLAAAVRSLVASALAAVALAFVYFPAVGALATRAPKLLGVLPWLPLGALRAVFSGNGAIFGDHLSSIRIVSTTRAGLTLAGWLIALCLVATSRSAGLTGLREFRHARPLMLGTATLLAFGVGWGLPTLAAGRTPWQWSRQWRDAQAHHRSTIQDSLRWANSAGRVPLYAEPEVSSSFDRSGLIGVPSFRVQLPSATDLNGPLSVPVILQYARPIHTGNMTIGRARYQLSFTYRDGRYLISGVDGPFVEARATPR